MAAKPQRAGTRKRTPSIAMPNLQVGDIVPRIVLPDCGGGRVDLRHQSIAGRPIALWLSERWPEPKALSAFGALLPDFDAAETTAFLVICGAEALKPPPLEATVPVLLDPKGGVAGGFGIEGSALIVIDLAGRLAGRFSGAALGEALALCRGLFVDTPQLKAARHAPVLLVEEILEPALCRRLIDYWESGEKHADEIAYGSENQRGDAVMKKRRDVTIGDAEVFSAVKTRLVSRLVPEVHKAFGVAVNHFEALRIGCYEGSEQGYFRRHRDNTTKFTAHRKFAMALNLNVGEYEGGTVRFPEYGRLLYQAPTGAAVVFSCSLLHEVEPVTAGRRFAVITFLFDEAGARREQELIAAERATGRQGVRMRTSNPPRV
jgi:predicted 2-oxoglutarate/Fe(II)-dependent dioxygenase YbiX